MSPTEFLRCSECRALNEPQALFCSRCGASLYGPHHGSQRRRRKRITPAGVALGVIILLLLAAAVFTLDIIVHRALSNSEPVNNLAGGSGTVATLAASTGANGQTTVTSSGSTDTTGDSTASSSGQAATLIRPESAVASSTLKATETNSYGATNLLDGDVTSAWSEGVTGDGIGEWVKFTFASNVVLSRIEIANGYQKDQQTFEGNPRVKSLKIEYSNGTTQLVDLLDTTEFQSVTPTREPVNWVKFVIVSVYPGNQWDDTSLSDVRFYAASQ